MDEFAGALQIVYGGGGVQFLELLLADVSLVT
jgi:hypothetical protein